MVRIWWVKTIAGRLSSTPNPLPASTNGQSDEADIRRAANVHHVGVTRDAQDRQNVPWRGAKEADFVAHSRAPRRPQRGD